MIQRVIFMLWLFARSSLAMLSDGIHLPEAYVKFAHSQKAFQASCFIYDHQRHILQTGVLITPDIVMTAAHGFEGKIHFPSLIVGFGDTISRDSTQNYSVKALRRHPSYGQELPDLKPKYDMIFLKLTNSVNGIEPVPLFQEEILEDIPPLYVATFGSADISLGKPVNRRAFVLPETDIFTLTDKDPERFYDIKTVMMGSIFFDPNNNSLPTRGNAPEREIRTTKAKNQWQKMAKPPFALTLPGSSGAPVFINLVKNGVQKTYVFGIIQSFSHLSDSTFKYTEGEREVQRLLKARYPKLYGHYQSVFCIPYEVHTLQKRGSMARGTYHLSPVVKKILAQLQK